MGRTAIWTSIRDALSAEIAQGHYAPGDKLPTEAALAARFGVNRHTVRRALAALGAAGLTRARRGAGVFVAARPADYPIGRRVRFHRNLAEAGRAPERRLLRRETRAADAREAAALQLPEGAQVHVIEGISLADGAPLALFRSLFPAARFPGLLDRLGRIASVTEALRAEGGARLHPGRDPHHRQGGNGHAGAAPAPARGRAAAAHGGGERRCARRAGGVWPYMVRR